MNPPGNGEGGSTGPPDRQTLRLLEGVLAEDPTVATTEFEPNGSEPTLLRASFETDRYPDTVEAARLDVRWFASGDFSMHYVETLADGDRWECRWDRHPNPHDGRLHFHRPPTGDEVEALEMAAVHPLDVTATVLAAVEPRIEGHWSADGS
ncbi:hypothetical protein [Saliphagus infecundisoli]|uniref:Uncharacterized protein n=1 Tax=Saliphagus infecundisoli TaxID=1849069 RepID=A0ABD5QIN5_9EURY|nr:hypothetical protein [Saliphagus infecundisoli]